MTHFSFCHSFLVLSLISRYTNLLNICWFSTMYDNILFYDCKVCFCLVFLQYFKSESYEEYGIL